MKKLLLVAALAALSLNAAAGGVDVSVYTRKDQFTDIRISPGGQYFAATLPMEDRSVLAVIERQTGKLTGTFRLPRDNYIADFEWVGPERVVLSAAEKFGSLDEPQPTGELFAMNADGGKAEMLVGYRTQDGGLGTNIKPKKGNDRIWAYLIPTPVGDGRTALISAQPYSRDPHSTAERIDAFTGRMQRVAIAPMRNARFATDNQGVVRFTWGSNSDNIRHLYYRTGDGAAWDLVTIEKDGLFEVPVGFSADNQTVYLQVEQPSGPDAIVAMDLATRKRTQVLRDDRADPWRIIYRNNTRVPIGAYFSDGRLHSDFFEREAPEARLQKSLEAAFAGQGVVVTSQTNDGSLALVQVYSDQNPGDFYLFDTKARKAAHVLAKREWFDPAQQATSKPIEVKARDGMLLHGYITTPNGSNGRNLPLVVMPHGGPIDVQDHWEFDSDAQLLSAAGYAVLQLNYRGSSGYGKSYVSAGAREWGGRMQDDLTDATRWAIAEGIADKGRICLYGASYGAYASLMGVAKEPDLYKCAVGYVGVYDLPKMIADDTRDSRRSGNWLREWVGDPAALGDVSPNRLADRIKVPVFLAAGGEDRVAPIEHSRMMESALRKAGVPVETLYYDTEAHGFYTQEHRQAFYTQLLAFLSRSLGGAVATTGAGAAEAKAAK
ncbi:alpha/beta hydrolase family protein [Lysobacter changpingensis]|uniref:alpha/beta hydrolase family protein n=1 Tax=Lysobacter changpingensis TaxID=2792784 RepID=UPI001A907307|nr:S9 family peptidase [Lysobacter changpingensis]